MTRRMLAAAGGVGLLLAIGILTISGPASAADDDPPIIVPPKIRDAINKMADQVAKGENDKVAKDAADFFKADTTKDKENFKRAMWVFKPREEKGKGGFGIGAKPGEYSPDGIEAMMFIQTGKNPPALNLKKSGEDLIRVADVTLAMSELVGKYTPTKKDGDKDPKIWKGANEDMKDAALKLKAAVKAGNNEEVKKAFLKLGGSCNRCHTTFRAD